MLNRIKKIREQQRLSVEFVTRVTKIPREEYLNFEANKAEISTEELENLTKLLGVEYKDIYKKDAVNLDVGTLGLARTYSHISQKDQIAISKLINVGNKINYN